MHNPWPWHPRYTHTLLDAIDSHPATDPDENCFPSTACYEHFHAWLGRISEAANDTEHVHDPVDTDPDDYILRLHAPSTDVGAEALWLCLLWCCSQLHPSDRDEGTLLPIVDPETHEISSLNEIIREQLQDDDPVSVQGMVSISAFFRDTAFSVQTYVLPHSYCFNPLMILSVKMVLERDHVWKSFAGPFTESLQIQHIGLTAVAGVFP